MRKIFVICLQTALFTMTCCDNITTDNIQGSTLRLRSHDGINPRYTQTEQPPGSCICSKIYDPICASNNESYYNLCYLECEVPKADNVSVIHQGNCIPY